MTKSPTALSEDDSRSADVAAVLAAARAVLENRAFADAAKAVFGACKTILGADAGLIAVCAPRKPAFDITFLDPGNLDLVAAAGMPAQLQRLSVRARKGKTVFANHLSKESGTTPSGRRALESAIFAPIIVAGEVVGLLGLINKAGGFSSDDSRFAEAFARLIALAMLNSRTINGLEKNRERVEGEFRTLVESLPDIVARFDHDLRYLYVSSAVEPVTGRPPQEFVGRTNRELGMAEELVEPWDDALRRVFATGEAEKFEFAFPGLNGTRYFDCQLVPERGPGGTIPSALSIARDVTERWLAHEAERKARDVADALREATIALTRSFDRETVLTTLLDRMRAMVPFDRGSVMLVENASRISVRAIFDGDRVVPLTADTRSEFDPIDHPIVRDILTTGAPILIPDIRAYPDWSLPADLSSEASWMGIPLFARGDVAGLFSLSKSEAAYFNEQHVRLAEAMSSQASVAVENAVLFEQMQSATVRMKALSRRLIDVQETERRHIARELHDEAGQALVSLRYGLRLLEKEIGEGKVVSDLVEELVRRTDEVNANLHRLAANLRPPSLDHLGLEAALRQYSRSVGAEFGLTVRFKASGFTGVRLPTTVETALYRVVQEAMANVVRHARATRVDVLVENHDGHVIVIVEDDGVGFDPGQVRLGDHFGLLGLKERAEALGGILRIESADGAGTTIVVEVADAYSNPDR